MTLPLRRLLGLSLAVAGLHGQGGWILRTPAAAPTPRCWSNQTYDLARGLHVLFGGTTSVSGTVTADTWEWNGATWTPRTFASVPPARCCSAFAHDLGRGRIVMFGGSASALSEFDDTWEYDGNAWTQVLAPTRPTGRRLGAMAYDPVRGGTLLFGGLMWSQALLSLVTNNETWKWDGVTWTRLQPAQAPSARWDHAMAGDVGRARVVLFGGSNEGSAGTVRLQDTWIWNGSNWQAVIAAPAPRAGRGAGMTYDWARGVVVLFGGDPVQPLSDETWLFSGQQWVRDARPMPPPPRTGGRLSHDVQRGRTLLFGGWSGSQTMGDTWEYVAPAAASWTPFGSGCAGSTGVPLLQPTGSSRPLLGATFALELLGVPASGVAAIAVGFSSTAWNGNALPLSLAALGMPGCTMFAAPEFLFAVTATNGRATWSWSLPSQPALLGATFFNQAIVVDPGVNAFGAVVANAGAGVLGLF